MTLESSWDMIGYTITVATDDPVLHDLLRRCYAGFPAADRAEHRIEVRPAPPPEEPDAEILPAEVVVDGTVVSRGASAGALLPGLVATINRRAAEASPHALVHAGAVERDGVGVVLAAPMESGKTTLTAGLVRAGFGYLTDEAATVDRDTVTLVPYPKPLSLDPGSWALFPELEPHEPFPDDGYKASQWQVPAVDIRPDALGRACPARFVVFPAYSPDTPTRLEPMSRAAALVELAKNTFRFDREGRPTFEVLARLVRGAEVFRLPLDDLDDAVAAVSRLVDG